MLAVQHDARRAGWPVWFGMPSLYVWICAWVLALTPALAAVEWGLWRPRERAGGERR
ncbi:hypothetical protein JK364_39130 [Streptomyces sp. 110]|uniref:DUF3311 domain-containing protein n=1 Tax=Streptomyces endocoffeicus TaxID=2898945 RepID=A0ABS1Q0X4_9ACTN|nr:hypothetical protein [Streptomyces endocoffeicus]MBL1118340.1 hypothetical protein [Streptomyces endocoffeicus]